MEITYLSMYLFTLLNNILAVAGIVGFVSFSFMVVFFVNWCLNKESLECDSRFCDIDSTKRLVKENMRNFKISMIPFVVCMLVVVFVPSQKEMAAIYIVPKVVNNEQINTITKDGISVVSRLVKLSNRYLNSLENKNGKDEDK